MQPERNVLAHEYGEVQAEIIWRVATGSIPAAGAVAERVESPSTEWEWQGENGCETGTAASGPS